MNIHISRAQLLLQQSRFELAEEQLRMALAEDSEDFLAHALLALCLLERKRYDDATTEAQEAIHASPDEAIGFYALATIMHERNRLKEAREAISEAVRIEPWNSMHFARLAAIEFSRSRWHDCLDAAEQGLEFEPENVECTNLRAMALVKLGRREEAGQSIDAALASEPDNEVTHANRGWALLHSGEPNKAAEHFREALRLDPTLEWARAGIVEAMKARNPIYRWMLAWFLWMSRFSPRVQIAMMLGLIFGNQILAAVCRSHPALEPFHLPLAMVYVLFAWMTWVAPSLFNLVLCLDRFGRLVLNRQEKQAAGLTGLCIVLTLAVGLFGHLRYSGDASWYWQTGALFLGLVIPVSKTFGLPKDRKKVMAFYSAGLTLVIAVALWKLVDLSITLSHVPAAVVEDEDKTKLKEFVLPKLIAFQQWWEYGSWGVVLSTWIGTGMTVVPERK
jgi:tetratricopeptide (TPR) repeat protein